MGASCCLLDEAAQPGTFALFPDKYAIERLRQLAVEPAAHDVDNQGLRKRFGLDRLMATAAALEAFVGFDDLWKIVAVDLLLSQRQAFPIKLAADDVFQDAAGVGFDVATSKVEIAEVADAVAHVELWADISVQEAADLAIGRGNAPAVLPD